MIVYLHHMPGAQAGLGRPSMFSYCFFSALFLFGSVLFRRVQLCAAMLQYVAVVDSPAGCACKA